MNDLIDINTSAFLGLGVITLLTFLGTLLLLPLLVARIPADYFVRVRIPKISRARRYPINVILLKVFKNVAGLVFIMAGIVMLFTPGQGLLAMLVGLSLTDFPGKVAVGLRILRQPGVLRAVNWIREKAKQPPLLVPPKEEVTKRDQGRKG